MNLMYGRKHKGRWIYVQPVVIQGSDKPVIQTKYLPNVYTVILYNKDGTRTALLGAGAERNIITSLSFEITNNGCSQFKMTLSELPSNLEYMQRIEIRLFNDSMPWYAGYVITRPIIGTTATSYEFAGHGYFNKLDNLPIFGTFENIDAAEIVRSIARQAESKLGLAYNGEKIVNTGYAITKIVFDGTTAKEAIKQLSDFAIDFVYGVDERRHLYFKPRVTTINEQARFWIGPHVKDYKPTHDIDKVVNWARVKGAQVDNQGEQWLATVQNTDSQSAYGFRGKILTLPSAYSTADAERWGQSQIERYKEPEKSAKISGVSLEYPNADGSFNVRKLSTDGMAAIYPTRGGLVTYPITKLKYSISKDKGIVCDMELGEQPNDIILYFAELDRAAKNAEALQAASTKQIATGG